jgi:hypothetical protein
LAHGAKSQYLTNAHKSGPAAAIVIAHPVITPTPERFNASAPIGFSAAAAFGGTSIRASFVRSLLIFPCLTSSSDTLRLIPDPGNKSQEISPTNSRRSKSPICSRNPRTKLHLFLRGPTQTTDE